MPLPEKELFTLDEIERRWQHAGCDRASLHEYAWRDTLIFSVYLRDIGSHKVIEDFPDRVVTKTRTVTKFIAPDHDRSPVRYLASDDARRILEAKNGEQIAVNALYFTPERLRKEGAWHCSPMYFSANDLRVTRHERDRFEERHNLNKFSGRFHSMWRWLRLEENREPLKTLVGLVTAALMGSWAIVTFLAK